MESKRIPTHWYTPQMPIMARLGQETVIQSRFLAWVVETKVLALLSAAFQGST